MHQPVRSQSLAKKKKKQVYGKKGKEGGGRERDGHYFYSSSLEGALGLSCPEHPISSLSETIFENPVCTYSFSWLSYLYPAACSANTGHLIKFKAHKNI